MTVRGRLAYPMDIEWMEGAHLYHAYRLTHGLYLYGDPARGFATFPYPPLYWLVVAAAGATFGLDYGTARAVSVACLLATAGILAAAIVRHAPTRRMGAAFAILALGGMAAGYPFAGGCYDLARADALALLLPVLAAALVGDGRLSFRRALGVGAVLTAAIYTKQTGVFYAAWLLVFVLVHHARSGIVLACTTALSSALLLGLLCAATRGWFWVWLFDQARHGLRSRDEWSTAFGNFVVHAPFLLVLPWLVSEARRRSSLRPATVKWVGLLVAAFVASMVPFMKAGGWVNVLMPFFMLSWPVTLLVMCDLATTLPVSGTASRGAFWGTLVFGGLMAWLLAFDPATFIPSAERWQGAARMHAFVRELDASVVFTTSPFLPIREGKRTEQPILQGYLDAQSGGVAADYAHALDQSGAEYLIVAAVTGERDYRPRLCPTFEVVRELDFGTATMPPLPLSLWRRVRVRPAQGP